MGQLGQIICQCHYQLYINACVYKRPKVYFSTFQPNALNFLKKKISCVDVFKHCFLTIPFSSGVGSGWHVRRQKLFVFFCA